MVGVTWHEGGFPLSSPSVDTERDRLARELHDTVAHAISLMIVQAGSARRAVRAEPDRAIESLEAIEAAGREAMAEMRRIVGGLRNPGDDDDPPPFAPPDLAAIDGLVAAAGVHLPVRVRRSGDTAAVPTQVQFAAYRVVQEALTNVRRHASKVTSVDVSIEASHRALAVTIDDDGERTEPAGPPGLGLAGMRERVALADGVLDAGSRPGGGWRVAATFMLNDA
jgi:signal transduction histidine kinase